MPTTLIFERALLGTDLTPTDDAWITIEGDTIVATGWGAAPDGAVRGPAPVAMPGLVDCHVHLALSGGPDLQAEAEAMTPRDAAAAIRTNARRHLESGVTTVRDLGSPHNAVIDFAQDPDAMAPAIVPAGAISSRTGHGSFLAAHAETFEEYDATLQRLATAAVPFVKLFATGGVITAGTMPGAVQMPGPLLTRVVARAHALGLRVAAHAHGHDGIANAVAACVDTVEHFSYLTDDDVAALRAGTSTLVSTYVATARFVDSPARHTATVETLAKIVDHAPHERAALVRALAAKVPLAVGTDAGTTFNPHGGGMPEQALHLSRAGAPPRDVLRALTVRGAETLRVRAGALAPGRAADVLCLDRDPHDDLAGLSNPRAVMHGGRWLDR